MAGNRRLIFAVLFCVIFAGTLFAAEGGTLIVRRVTGSAQYREADGGWQEVRVGTVLTPGMRVRTGANASLELGFDERGKSRLIFSSGTLDIDSPEGRPSGLDIRLYTGRIAASVEEPHAGNLSIRAGNAQVRVKGTEFGVEFNEGVDASSRVYVFNGSVFVQGLDTVGRPAGDPVVLKSGERATVNPNGNFQPLAPVQPEDETRFDMKVVKAPVSDPKPTPEAGTNAQKTLPAASRGYAPMTLGSGMGGSIGSEIIDGENWSVIVLTPRLQFGHFAFGLYLPVYAKPDDLFKPSEWYNAEEWDFTNFGDFIHDFLLKFMYIQWGQKHDPFFIKLGSIDDFVIGNGFLMNKFNNTLQFPSNRRIGFQFDTRLSFGGFECMFADVYEAQIFGGRIFVTPFTGVFTSFFSDFEIGLSYITDINASGKPKKAKSDDSEEPDDSDDSETDRHTRVYAFGVDVAQPLPSLGILTWSVFADYAIQGYKTADDLAGDIEDEKPGMNSRRGFSAGLRGRILFFDYLLAYRNLQGGFIAEYFDSFYYAQRSERADALIKGSDASYNGLIFRTGIEFKGIAYITLNFDKYYGTTTKAEGNDNKLGLYAGLEKGVIPKFHFTFMYERINFSANDLIKRIFGEDTVVTTKLYYEISKGVDIVATYRRFYDKDGEYKSSYSIDTEFKL